MKILLQCLAVGAAGAAGALTRFGVATLIGRTVGIAFPVGTLVINVTGSFVIGWFLAAFGQRYGPGDPVRLAVVTGFLGAYTTFSAFSYETLALLRDAGGFRAGAYVVASVALGLGAAGAGMAVGGRA